MAPQTIAVINGTARALTHVVTQALRDGDHVRALVRSASRYQAKMPSHKNLSVHEWSDFNDLDGLARCLDGVDVVYIALNAAGKDLLRPIWLNEDLVTSIGTVLHDRIAPGERSPTKIVLLSAVQSIPDMPAMPFIEMLLSHQYADLRAAQDYLQKQRSWLDSVYVAPGAIFDCEPSDDIAIYSAVELRADRPHPKPISYARLAAALRESASDPKYVGQWWIPQGTTPMSWKLKHTSSGFEVIKLNVRYRALPAMMRFIAVMTLGASIGYVLGVRDQGAWALSRLGWNLRA